MAGYGNGGMPPDVLDRMDDLVEEEERRPQTEEERVTDQGLWDEYRSARPYLAETPSAEAGRILIKNRDAIVKDARKRAADKSGGITGVPLDDEGGLDEAMRALAAMLVYGDANDGRYEELEAAAEEARGVEGAFALAAFLDGRMCVPRDMGAMSAGAIKRLSALR